MTRLIAAIDTSELLRATQLAQALRPHCAMLKLGLEFFLTHGGDGVRTISGAIFLDLKLHDIPATVAGAVGAILPLGIRLLTLHAAGGAAMIEAARRRAETIGADRPRLLAVTVLTSLSSADLQAAGVSGTAEAQVLRLARTALSAGADGLVCSPHELASLRHAFGGAPILVAPGVRPAGWAADDQTRVATPAEASRDGADYIVVGRPITASADPAAAAASIVAELA